METPKPDKADKTDAFNYAVVVGMFCYSGCDERHRKTLTLTLYIISFSCHFPSSSFFPLLTCSLPVFLSLSPSIAQILLLWTLPHSFLSPCCTNSSHFLTVQSYFPSSQLFSIPQIGNKIDSVEYRVPKNKQTVRDNLNAIYMHFKTTAC